jgi:hypothetical protein
LTPQLGFSRRLPRRGAPVKPLRCNSIVGELPNGQGIKTVPRLQYWMSQSPTNLDVVAPIKARACDALQTLIGSGRRHAAPHYNSRIMARGIERC